MVYYVLEGIVRLSSPFALNVEHSPKKVVASSISSIIAIVDVLLVETDRISVLLYSCCLHAVMSLQAETEAIVLSPFVTLVRTSEYVIVRRAGVDIIRSTRGIVTLTLFKL
jgi:hypothetical protein